MSWSFPALLDSDNIPLRIEENQNRKSVIETIKAGKPNSAIICMIRLCGLAAIGFSVAAKCSGPTPNQGLSRAISNAILHNSILPELV